ncbi:MAG: OadG family protein [Thiovulaceae bacterium]|nr:OadG family protein [Sulfurimonadaceae bacterium]MCW9025977.1 OadG family protein [Sulfurimonadaceae bacterium]
METNLVIEGFKFMGLGMATVFSFLIIMIIAMNVMSIIIHKFFPEPQAKDTSSANNANENKKVIAAITAAVKYHREG